MATEPRSITLEESQQMYYDGNHD